MAERRGVWRLGPHIVITVVTRRERAVWVTAFGLSILQEVPQRVNARICDVSVGFEIPFRIKIFDDLLNHRHRILELRQTTFGGWRENLQKINSIGMLPDQFVSRKTRIYSTEVKWIPLSVDVPSRLVPGAWPIIETHLYFAQNQTICVVLRGYSCSAGDVYVGSATLEPPRSAI